MSALLVLLLASVFPSTSQTSWMEPEAFHLRVGMSRAATVGVLDARGWKVKKGKGEDDLIVEYDEIRTLTLAFSKGKLTSIRFELVDFVPQIHKAFEEQKTTLARRFGKPTIKSGNTLIYDSQTPNIFAVVSSDPSTEFGKRGLGFLVVRYFEPPPPD
ncbi:MAG TPA: hypothetical protein VMS12_13320 [Thermoanaerobaculia bacterium]|nr:hypothetical protein [Thermoanaerobaculia bacterium]